MQLTQEQQKILGIYIDDFNKAPTVEDNNETIPDAIFDEKRMVAIIALRKMLSDFMSGTLSLVEFKEKSEAMSRVFPYWGFKNFSGQMQLNQYVNNIEDGTQEKRLKEALAVPKALEESVAKINTLAKYLAELKLKPITPRAYHV